MKPYNRNVEDIDLFVGGLSENKAFGSILGPTFGCLNGIQFFHWKYGDRFYFEHGGEAGSFTHGELPMVVSIILSSLIIYLPSLAEQLNNIRQTASLANLLCKTNHFDSVQANPQFRPSAHNPQVACHAFAEIDYELWREVPHSSEWKKK